MQHLCIAAAYRRAGVMRGDETMDQQHEYLMRQMFYHGLEKPQFEAIRDQMNQINYQGVRAFTIGGLFIYLALTLLTCLRGGALSMDCWVYLIAALIYLMLRIGLRWMKDSREAVINALAVVCMELMLLPGILIVANGTGLGAKSSLYLAFMMLPPLYVCLSGALYCSAVILTEVLYLVAISAVQAGTDAFSVNLLNSMIVTVVCIIVGPYSMRIKARGIYHYYELGRYSQVEEQKEQLEKNYNVISALMRPYRALYYVDVAANRYFELATDSEDTSALIGSEGVTEQAIEGLITTRVHPVYVNQVREFCCVDTVNERLKARPQVSCEYKNTYGQWRRAVFMAGDRDEAGNCVHVIWGVYDINEDKEQSLSQQRVISNAYVLAEQANRAKTMFLNSMSHDIRTPMNAIVGFANLASRSASSEEQLRDYMAKIQESGKHLVELINDVLDIGKIETGQLETKEESFSLPEVVHSILSVVNMVGRSKQLKLDAVAENVWHEYLVGDRLRLSQVLMNLTENAVKFTNPGGTISLRVEELANAPQGCATFAFYVRDNGVGIDERRLKQLLDPRKAEQGNVSGSGLGLAITRNVVDMLGGTMTATSAPGEGSEFVVTLTFRQDDVPEISEEMIQQMNQLEGKRMLIVDGCPTNAEALRKQHQPLGMQMDYAETGQEALRMATEAAEEKQPYEIILVDNELPDTTGIETIRKLKQLRTRHPVNMILMAFDWNDIEGEAKEAGASSFAVKPLFPSELHDRLISRRGKPGDWGPDPHMVMPPLDFTGNRILLVEDNALNREIAATILKEVGFDIDEAEDGDQALQMVLDAEEGRYDLILMDIRMPKMDGYECTRRIRELDDWEKADIPIVAMTANAFTEDVKLALDAGMDAHVAKPIDVKQLMDAIMLCLE